MSSVSDSRIMKKIPDAGTTSVLIFTAIDVVLSFVFVIILSIYCILRSIFDIERWHFEDAFPGIGLCGWIGLFIIRETISGYLGQAIIAMNKVWSAPLFYYLILPWNVFLLVINTIILGAILSGWAGGKTNVDTGMEIALTMMILISEFGYGSLLVQIRVAHEEITNNIIDNEIQ